MDRDRVLARGTALLGVATFALTTWIWVRTGSLRPVLRDPFTPTLSEAYLTGLWSAHLMLLQVALMARVPWLERAWGRARLTRWHRWLGHASFWLMVVHVYLFTLQRLLREPGRRGEAVWELFVTEPWMLPATIGTAMVVLVVATSVRVAVRRLRYESWHLLHLWAYVGMALALPHMLVSADFGVGWVRAYWWVLYVGVLAAVLWWRVVVPMRSSRRHDLRVASVSREPGVVSVEVGGRALEQLGARAGDFLTWRFLAGRGALAGHPYSLSAPPHGTLRLTVGDRSAEAERLAALAPGTRVLVEGPYGDLAGLRRRHERLLLVGAGIGITPLLALLEHSTGPVTVVHRVSEAPGPLGERLAAVAASRGADLVVLAGPRRSAYSWLPKGRTGDESEVLAALVPDLPACDVVVCGPQGWSEHLRASLRDLGVRRRDVHAEEFGWTG